MCRFRNDRARLPAPLLIAVILAGFLAEDALAQSTAEPSSEPAVGKGTLYLLEVRVNDWPLGLVASFHDENGRLSISAEQFDGLGFKLDEAFVTTVASERRVYLDQVPGLQWAVDMRAQSIALTAPFSLLKPTQLQLSTGHPRIESRSDWGILLAYDAYGEWSTRADAELYGRSLSTNVEARLFSPHFTASTTGYYLVSKGAKDEFVRLNSTIDFDDPANVWRLRLGDSFTTGPNWVRPVRFGGAQWFRDFALRPDIVTTPMPTLNQDVAVPSTVDVFINGVRRYSQGVDPGAIRVTDLPVATGSNMIAMVVTDQAGRRTEVTLPLYSSNRLLGRGITSFNVEAGAVRRNYAIASNDYGGRFASGSFSRGVSDAFTLTGYGAVAGRGYWGAGLGATVAIGGLLLVDVAAMRSDGDTGGGWAWHAGLEHVARRFSVAGRYTRAGRSYSDLAGRFGYTRFTEQASASLGIHLGGAGQLNFAYAMQRPIDRARTSVVSATYGINLFRRRVHLSASGYTDTEDGSWGAFAAVTVPLGRAAQAYVQQGWRNGNPSTTAQIRGSALRDRLDWEVEGTRGDFDEIAAQAAWDGERADLYARVARSDGVTGFQAALAQSLVLMDESLFLAGRIDDGFTVVDVEESPGVRVALENRTVGRTNADGRIFVTGLQSYAANSVSIEPLDLPLGAGIAKTAQLVAPRRGGGTITRFAVTYERAALVTLALPDGSPPPVGARARLEGSDAALVTGFDGEIYVRGLKAGANRLDLHWNDGQCSARFTAEVERGSLSRLGPFTCAQ